MGSGDSEPGLLPLHLDSGIRADGFSSGPVSARRLFFVKGAQSSLPGFHRNILEIVRAQGALLLSDRQESRIELDEGSVHGGVLGMAGVASGRLRKERGLAFIGNVKEGPLAGEAALVLDMNFQSHDGSALEVSCPVDGAFVLGST